VGQAPVTDGQNTLVGSGPDTAMIVTTAPAESPTDSVPVGTPQPVSQTSGHAGHTGNSASSGAAPGGSSLPLNKLSKYRMPRKPR
jgi:hypothetical protein